MRSTGNAAGRPQPDALLREVAGYVTDFSVDGERAYEMARLCLMDALACAFLALEFPDCRRLLGPVVPGATLPGGARVPGTAFELEPVQAAFNTGALIRWLDFNDTWLAAEWGHPSDNIGGLLALADYLGRRNAAAGASPAPMRDLFTAMIKAYEIQGVLALGNSLNEVGLDHVVLVRVATAAVAMAMLGGGKPEVVDVLSQAWMDGGPLRAYRHAPNTGSRKSWAAGDATARGVRLALMVAAGEMGYPSVLSAPRWGFSEVLLDGRPLVLTQAMGTHVVENVLFKAVFPAEFHGQTAVEAALELHPAVRERLDEVDRVVIDTQAPAMRIIDKRGPLANAADRDHCIQYMTALALIFGSLEARDYEAERAADPRIDELREKMEVRENPQFTRDYYAADKRYIANAVQVFFRDGTASRRVCVDVPVGHPRRREELRAPLQRKFQRALAPHLPPERLRRLTGLWDDPSSLDTMSVDAFVAMLVQ